MPERKIKLTNGGKEVELSIAESTEGPAAVNISNLYKKRGYFSLDPGFVSTASCRSQITYIDGDLGLLRYRGYPIEQLAESGNHIETACLLLDGELPTQSQLDTFVQEIKSETKIPDGSWELMQAFEKEAHPMAMLMAGLAHLASIYHSELDVFDEAYRQRMARRLIAQVPVLAALGYRYRTGQDPIDPDPELDFTSNFLHMMFGASPTPSSRTPWIPCSFCMPTMSRMPLHPRSGCPAVPKPARSRPSPQAWQRFGGRLTAAPTRP